MQTQKLVARVKLGIERARARYASVDIGVTTFRNFSAVDGGTYTAALTYYFFFSIFPLLLFAASILGYLTFGDDTLRKELMDAGLRSVPLLRSVLSAETLALIEERRGQMAVTGVALALYSGTGAIVALGHALNKIHGIDEEGNFFVKRAKALKWMLVLGVAAALSLALGTAAGYATNIFDGSAAVVLTFAVGHLAGFIVGFLTFATAFRFLPNRPLTWAEVVPGAVTAAALFEVLKEVGTWYLEQGAKGRAQTFGTLAAAAGLLVASYLIAQITLLSASLNDVLAERRLTRRPPASGDREGQDG